MSEVRQRSGAVHPPSVGGLIDALTGTLLLGGVEGARRVSVDIVAALLEVSRTWPLMHAADAVSPEIASSSSAAARRIVKGTPFCYAVGSAPFRHLNLAVDERVLIPRPETEVLVSELLEMCQAQFAGDTVWGTALDIGTGSGAIAISLASEGKFRRVIATDASSDALDVARSNAARSASVIRAAIEFRQGSLLAPVRDVQASVVVSNPPYIAFSEIESLPRSVRDWEPPLALLSGGDGLAATAAIVRDAAGVLRRGGIFALEVDERRASLVADMLLSNRAYAEIGVKLDLTGRERFVFAIRV